MEDKFYFDRPEVRKAILEQFSVAHIQNMQSVPTPLWVVKEMTDLITDTPDLLYVVLFNVEFLEELIYNRMIPSERIMFMADNRHEANLSMAVYKVPTLQCRLGMTPESIIRLVGRKINKAFYKGEDMPKTNNLVVFGNPPYQSEDGGFGKSSKPIYQDFVTSSIKFLNPRYLCMITPSRWMAGGKGLDDYRSQMMKDKHIRVIKHFTGDKKVFENVIIKGGVSYFLRDREKEGKCNFNGKHRFLNEYDIILSDNEAVSILDKTLSTHTKFMNEKVLGRKPFGLPTNFSNWKGTGTPCYMTGKNIKHVNPSDYTDNNNVEKLWKVCMSEAINPNQEGRFEVYNQLFVAEKNYICTETYIVVNYFKTKEEAENFITYMKTKFFRFMLGLRVVTQHVNKDKFSFTPDLEDYSKPWTDAELYKMFKLSHDEIAYIESKLKELK